MKIIAGLIDTHFLLLKNGHYASEEKYKNLRLEFLIAFSSI